MKPRFRTMSHEEAHRSLQSVGFQHLLGGYLAETVVRLSGKFSDAPEAERFGEPSRSPSHFKDILDPEVPEPTSLERKSDDSCKRKWNTTGLQRKRLEKFLGQFSGSMFVARGQVLGKHGGYHR